MPRHADCRAIWFALENRFMSEPPARVLYVEQRLVDLLLMQMVLRTLPRFELHLARSGAQALQMAPQLQPALLLIGLDLPDGDGVALLGSLRRLDACVHVPAVALTADAHSGALLAGFAEVWIKPVDLRGVGERVQRLCRGDAPSEDE
jgi:CheY-like chemotaxis protein